MEMLSLDNPLWTSHQGSTWPSNCDQVVFWTLPLTQISFETWSFPRSRTRVIIMVTRRHGQKCAESVLTAAVCAFISWAVDLAERAKLKLMSEFSYSWYICIVEIGGAAFSNSWRRSYLKFLCSSLALAEWNICPDKSALRTCSLTGLISRVSQLSIACQWMPWWDFSLFVISSSWAGERRTMSWHLTCPWKKKSWSHINVPTLKAN